ncbi:RNA polymerase I-associated factor PAF67-domain-containing protein [Lactarius pseudohatsudake]|nr:RNA polymerase I-associated factor PAF67-domain-containing protein [Lactarius pseudohatsudake]
MVSYEATVCVGGHQFSHFGVGLPSGFPNDHMPSHDQAVAGFAVSLGSHQLLTHSTRASEACSSLVELESLANETPSIVDPSSPEHERDELHRSTTTPPSASNVGVEQNYRRTQVIINDRAAPSLAPDERRTDMAQAITTVAAPLSTTKVSGPHSVLFSAVKLARPIAYKAPPAFEELFLYACPKFISANPPPYGDPEQLALYTEEPPSEPVQHHLALFVANMRAQAAAPTLRSFLKLQTRNLPRRGRGGDGPADDGCQSSEQIHQPRQTEKNLLDGQMISTSDMDFVINENMVHISEVTVGCRFAGWLIRNTEHTQRVLDGVKNGPLHLAPQPAAGSEAESKSAPTQQKKVAWQQRPRHSIRRCCCVLTLHVVQRGRGTVFPYATKRGLRRRPTCRRSTLRREVQAAQRENSDRSRQRPGECEDDV